MICNTIKEFIFGIMKINILENFFKMLNKEIDENTREIIIKSFHEVRNLTAFSDKYDKIYMNLRKS
jgi:hypothetical protein